MQVVYVFGKDYEPKVSIKRFSETRSRTKCDLKGLGYPNMQAFRQKWLAGPCLPSSRMKKMAYLDF